MTLNLMSVTVEGEPLELLLRALSKFQFEEERGGMVRFTVKLPPELGLPFRRAHSFGSKPSFFSPTRMHSGAVVRNVRTNSEATTHSSSSLAALRPRVG
jgi:hypothetical protein